MKFKKGILEYNDYKIDKQCHRLGSKCVRDIDSQTAGARDERMRTCRSCIRPLGDPRSIFSEDVEIPPHGLISDNR